MKEFTSQEISDMYLSLSSEKQVCVLLIALDIMQQYNGRTRLDCIALAMGYIDEIGDGIYIKQEQK